MLEANLFGQFDLRLDNEPLQLSSRPAQTLLAYLLLNRDVVHARSRLAGLLWPDSDENSARQNLRNALYRLRQAIGDDYLLADRTSVGFNTAAPYRLDVALLEEGALPEEGEAGEGADDLTAAVSVYRGELLPGFYEEWVLLERERLRALFERRMKRLLDSLGIAGRWTDVERWAERWIGMGHVPEPAYRALMKAHAARGDLAGAVASYYRCVEALEEELGVSPSEETQTLYRRLSDGEGVAKPAGPSPLAADPSGNLPAPSTPFFGRQEELVEISRLLEQEADCRLLTLVGPGGIGKTRLALEAARAAAFDHGAWFVPLAPLGSSASLISAIADRLGLHLHSSADPRQQLVAHLEDRELLLLLDNFEHLLSPLGGDNEQSDQDGADVIADLLERASRIKLLVTSRERLNLTTEWVFPVEGLEIPEDAGEEGGPDASDFSAVQLFLQRARQVRREFGRDGDELACIARICRLVGGMPLAIELAAAWSNTLGCREIVSEIEHSLGFLRARLRDVPERHRDIQAVFDSSWKMLDEPEQRLFRRLSVFRGGFTRAAAEAVGGETAWTADDLIVNEEGELQLTRRQPHVLAALARLVDKSFVRRGPSGRYVIHELMRQYGAAKLLERPEEERAARDHHASYYLAFLIRKEWSLRGSGQRRVVEIVARDIENVRAAWNWAVGQCRLAVVNQALSAYFNFFMIRSRLQEGEESFARLVEQLERRADARNHPAYEMVLARALIRRAAFCYLFGRYDAAKRFANAGLAMDIEADYPSDVAFAQIVLGVVAGWQGERELAEEWLEKSLVISRSIDDKENLADALHELAHVRSSFGDYEEAKRLAEESLVISRDYGRPDWVAHALISLGWATVCQGDYEAAEAHYREALAIFESLGSRHGVADALEGLGWICWSRGGEDLDQAADYYERSLAILREIGQRRLLANALCDVAILASERGDYDRTEVISREGLDLAEKLDSPIYKVPYLCCLGSAARGRGYYDQSRRFLREALQVAYNDRLWPPLMMILYEFARLYVAETDGDGDGVSGGATAMALELLTVVIHHSATWQGIRERAARLHTELEAVLPATAAAGAKDRGKSKTLDAVVDQLCGVAVDSG